MEVLFIDAKELSKIINDLAVKPGGTLRFYGEWFGRPYDNYHKILECVFKDEILYIKFDAGETIKIWNPNNIILNNDELIIKNSTCVEFLRYDYDKQLTKELKIDRYSDEEFMNLYLQSGEVYKKPVKHDYPAFELLKY